MMTHRIRLIASQGKSLCGLHVDIVCGQNKGAPFGWRLDQDRVRVNNDFGFLEQLRNARGEVRRACENKNVIHTSIASSSLLEGVDEHEDALCSVALDQHLSMKTIRRQVSERRRGNQRTREDESECSSLHAADSMRNVDGCQ